jgi:hypothetical protein
MAALVYFLYPNNLYLLTWLVKAGFLLFFVRNYLGFNISSCSVPPVLQLHYRISVTVPFFVTTLFSLVIASIIHT